MLLFKVILQGDRINLLIFQVLGESLGSVLRSVTAAGSDNGRNSAIRADIKTPPTAVTGIAEGGVGGQRNSPCSAELCALPAHGASCRIAALFPHHHAQPGRAVKQGEIIKGIEPRAGKGSRPGKYPCFMPV